MSEAAKQTYLPSSLMGISEVDKINSLLFQYTHTTLDELAEAALLERKERKYLISSEQAADIIEKFKDDYYVLQIESQRVGRYETLYFDTDDMMIYMQHHNGRKNRYKLRSRLYASTGISFMEVKHKVNTGKTKKSRIETEKMVLDITPDLNEFLSNNFPYCPEEFHPQILNTYNRVTLVAKDHSERITIDFDLTFSHYGETVKLPKIAVVELKTGKRIDASPFEHMMREIHVRSTSFSKYCIGVALLFPNVKKNRFKSKIMQIKRMTGSDNNAA